MRYVWIVFLTLATLLLGLLGWQKLHPAPVAATRPDNAAPIVAVVAKRTVAVPKPTAAPAPPAGSPRAEALIDFAMQQLGTRYCYAGSSPEGGFDCSGFVRYVFSKFAIDVPHSTAQLISVGQLVPRTQARPGDIVVFTGTAATSTTPGHAGIVLSKPGEPLRFIHSSSARRESGVKISTVEGTDYERRFMAVRRVL